MSVSISVEKTVIPTYGIGTPNKNPMFLEKRVYQGSSGKVYPYPVVDRIFDEKKDKTYTAVILENEYLKIMVLPELGGRIQRALDKTNGYDFVYYNHVIKPALVGLTGPWISGGIEFNWPQHHRPSTFLPVDFTVKEYDDGSKSVLLNDTDRINGTKSITEIRLYPGKAYIEIRGQLYNPTPFPQTFLWWANPAVAVNNDTQSVFPPDVHAVMDHGKRDVSRFPIATGVYYKHDYGEGVDISRYRNIPVPTSYMAEKSDFNFVGGYDYGKKAGILHVADHHVSPGKKQWTWGSGDFGKAWDRNLTDEDGPYIELMTGVYTDNQPDFTWLKPFEEKSFTQYFMPYKDAGYIKNASTRAAVNLELEGADGERYAQVRVYTTAKQQVSVSLYCGSDLVWSKNAELSPEKTLIEDIPLTGNAAEAPEKDFMLTVRDADSELISYRPLEEKPHQMPEPAAAPLAPADIKTNEELYLTGLHIEQYRHATFLPDPYYLEGLKRDDKDIRINTAYARLLLQRGCFSQAESQITHCLPRLFLRNPNPYTSEPLYILALSQLYQDKLDEAFDNFYKATWSAETQEMSFYYLAAIASRKHDYLAAKDFIGRSLIKNSHNIKARALQALILNALGEKENAAKAARETLSIDCFDLISLLLCDSEEFKEQAALRKNTDLINAAINAADGGFYTDAIKLLSAAAESDALVMYYQAYYETKLSESATCKDGRPDDAGSKAFDLLSQAEKADSTCIFPNTLTDILVLQAAIEKNPAGAKAPYYLGNLFYDKRQYEKARELWEQSEKNDDSFPTVHRNLALLYYNKSREPEKARLELEKAFALDKTDARVFMELDQLKKILGATAQERLSAFMENKGLIKERDDLAVEYLTLLNLTEKYSEAADFLEKTKFHPWEGGEGRVTAQYVTTLRAIAQDKARNGKVEEAISLLNKALIYPENLGEGKLEGTKNNDVHYELGTLLQAAGKEEEAAAEFQLATAGDRNPAGVLYYNDQPADMILYQGLALQKLGDETAAKACFHSLIDYGETHQFDTMKIDFFAVSLPDLQIFEDDLDKKNKVHCSYLQGLGWYGLGEYKKAAAYLTAAVKDAPCHQKALELLSAAKKAGGLA
ncbi:MAG: DUF5107 domain-containing protein [Treponema sp.]|nr:DUF5107 domain-containing protein [Treponema sp.]